MELCKDVVFGYLCLAQGLRKGSQKEGKRMNDIQPLLSTKKTREYTYNKNYKNYAKK